MYLFITSDLESGENNIDYGNENMKTLKMGSFRDALKRPRDSNTNNINDEFNNEGTPGFSTPVRHNDEPQNVNVNIENLNHIDIGITPQVMLTSHSSHDTPSHYKLQDSADVIRRLESPLVTVGFKIVTQEAYDDKRLEFLNPSLHFNNAYHLENKLIEGTVFVGKGFVFFITTQATLQWDNKCRVVQPVLNVLGWSTHITQMIGHHTHRFHFHSGTKDCLRIIYHVGHNYVRAHFKLPVTYTEFSYGTDKYTPNSIEGEYMCFNPRKVNYLPRHSAGS